MQLPLVYTYQDDGDRCGEIPLHEYLRYNIWFQNLYRTILKDGNQITRFYRKGLQENGEIVNRKIHNEFDDAISRLTSHSLWTDPAHNPALVEKFLQELGKMLHKPKVLHAVALPEIGDDITFTMENGVGTFFEGEKMIYSYRHTDFLRRLNSFYDLPEENAMLISFVYWTQRSHSGSNWSPSKSYPDLVALRKKLGECTIVECFCGLMNNQDLIYRTIKKAGPVTDYRLALDAGLLRSLTRDQKFVGTWPDGLFWLMEHKEISHNLVLLCNPPYSEPEIHRTFAALGEFYGKYDKEYNIMTYMTLPNWPDLFTDKKLVGSLRPSKILKNEIIKNDLVFNASSYEAPKRINFAYRQLHVGKK